MLEKDESFMNSKKMKLALNQRCTHKLSEIVHLFCKTIFFHISNLYYFLFNKWKIC